MPEISVAAGGRVFRAFGHIAHPPQRHVKAGDKMVFGLATMTFPLDAGLDESDSLARRVRYLRDPTGLKVRGALRVGQQPARQTRRHHAHTNHGPAWPRPGKAPRNPGTR